MTKANKTLFWQKALYVFLLYSTIFSPPLAIGGMHLYFGLLLWPISIVYVFNNGKVFYRFHKRFSKEFILIYWIIGYSLFRSLLGGNMNIATDNFFGIMNLIIIPFFYVAYGRKIGIDSVEDMTKYLLWSSIIAIASTILALLIPSVDYFFRNVFIQYREDELGSIVMYRGYGLGSNMSSFFSFCIGMIVVFSFIYGRKERWYKWLIPFAFLASVVNARTGVIVSLVGIIIYFLFSSNFRGLIITVIIGVLGYVYINDILGLFLGEETIEWIGVFMDNVMDSASGDFRGGGLDYFTKDMAITPDSSMGWILGKGVSTLGGVTVNGKYYFSDIGFVIQLFYGGLIYCTMLYSLVLIVCYRLWKRRQKTFSIFLLATFLIINFKGTFLFAKPGFALALIMYYSVSLLGSTQNKYHPQNTVFIK